MPATTDEWLTGRAGELDGRLKRFSRRLLRGELERVELRNGRLDVALVKTATPPTTCAFADGIEAMMPPASITELLYKVNRMTDFASAFINLRSGSATTTKTPCLPPSSPTLVERLSSPVHAGSHEYVASPPNG